jgi:hypothetical protein
VFLTVVEMGRATLTWTLPLFMTVSQLRVGEEEGKEVRVASSLSVAVGVATLRCPVPVSPRNTMIATAANSKTEAPMMERINS